jgi:hypothetical protein
MAIAVLTAEQQKRATDKLIQWIEIDKRIVSFCRSVPPASNWLWLGTEVQAQGEHLEADPLSTRQPRSLH